MRLTRLTPETEELLRSIWTPYTFAERAFGLADRRISLIEQVAESGEIAAIFSLLELLFDKSPTVAAATADCLHRLVQEVAPQDYAVLDEQMRSWTYEWDRTLWRRRLPHDVSQLPKTADSHTSVVGLASLHQSGHVREAAIRELAQSEDGSELPFLLLRLNDWVENVRTVAIDAVRCRMTPGYFGHFVRYIYLVARLVSCKRGNHEDIIRWTISQLVSPEHEEALRQILEGPDRFVRRKCFQLALELEGPHRIRVVKAGLSSADVVIQLRAAQSASHVLAQAELVDALIKMEQDRFMPIRREALRARMETRPELADSFLKKTLLDRSASIRELARFHLGKNGQGDFATIYRQALADRQNIVVALAGLGETGTEADLSCLSPYLNSRFNRERAASVRALGDIGGEKAIADLLGLLADDSGKVTKAAMRGLVQHAEILDPEILRELFVSENRRHVQIALVDLIDRTGRWSGLPALIRIAAGLDESLTKWAEKLVTERFNHLFTTPTPQVRDQICSVLHDCGSQLDEQFRTELHRWLKSRGVDQRKE